jgi:predicted Kef-type K+ transport protein
MVATVILVTCLVCPLVELFDNWDHTVQTGNDTEYTLVVLALCVGVAYSFARFVLKYSLHGFLAVVFATDIRKSSRSAFCHLRSLRFHEISPPPLALRI